MRDESLELFGSGGAHFHPVVQDFHRGSLVDDGLEVLGLFAGLVQFFLRDGGGQVFIDIDQPSLPVSVCV